jgi:hypothetical protein
MSTTTDYYLVIKASDVLSAPDGNHAGAPLMLDQAKLIELAKNQVLAGTGVHLCGDHLDDLGTRRHSETESKCSACRMMRDW